MNTLFETLPCEVNLLILEKINRPSDLKDVCRVLGLEPSLLWNVWRKMAKEEMQIPEWYFDLPLEDERKIDGERRFFEIQSKISVSWKSVAKISDVDGQIIGFYSTDVVRIMAERQGNVDTARFFRSDYIGRTKKNRQLLKAGMCDVFTLPKHFPDFDKSSKPLDLKKLNLHSIRNDIVLTPFSGLVGPAIATGDNNLFELVKEISVSEYPRDSERQLLVLMYCLASRNFEHFSRLYSASRIKHEQKSTLLERAYYLAYLDVIDFLEQWGVSIPLEKRYEYLDEGHRFKPRPIEVYQICERLVRIDKPNKRPKFVEQDADIFVMFYQKGWVDGQQALLSDDFSVEIFSYLISFLEESELIKLKDIFHNKVKLKILSDKRN